MEPCIIMQCMFSKSTAWLVPNNSTFARHIVTVVADNRAESECTLRNHLISM